MKKIARLLIPLILVFAIAFQFVPVVGSGINLDPPQEDIMPLGSDITLPPHIRDEGITIYHSIFTINAVEVHNSLFSSAGGKSFRLIDLPSSATKIYLSGTLYHSLASESHAYRMYVGICYYNGTTDEYVSLYQTEFSHGVEYKCPDVCVDISDLRIRPNYEYEELFTYIRNDHPAGTTYVWGSLTVSYR